MRLAVGQTKTQVIPWASNARNNIATVTMLTVGYSFISFNAGTAVFSVSPGYTELP